jgi:hypothetical protein
VDDDDNSWKVRRAAVHVLSAFIRARSDILKEFYGTLSDTFIDRFKERDANVKLAVLSATCDLLRESVVARRDTISETKAVTLNVPVLVRTRSSFQAWGLPIPLPLCPPAPALPTALPRLPFRPALM